MSGEAPRTAGVQTGSSHSPTLPHSRGCLPDHPSLIYPLPPSSSGPENQQTNGVGRLYLGSWSVEAEKEPLQQLGVTHILQARVAFITPSSSLNLGQKPSLSPPPALMSRWVMSCQPLMGRASPTCDPSSTTWKRRT